VLSLVGTPGTDYYSRPFGDVIRTDMSDAGQVAAMIDFAIASNVTHNVL